MTSRLKSRQSTDAKTKPLDQLITDGVLDIDEAAEVIPFSYAITAYGADYPVDGLVKRLGDDTILVPVFAPVGSSAPKTKEKFQRQYVWKKQQADRFVESLLLGLPVPGIFLVKEDDGRLLVLDGHQRLVTLQRFYANDWEGAAFTLESVQARYANKTYADLDPSDRRRLDDSIIHATIVRQDEPSEDRSSIYLVFERLNSGGTSLQPQEIRVALYRGAFVELLGRLNSYPSWRALFGRRSARLKDMELILRFFALLEGGKSYARPMKSFLSGYMAKRRHLSEKTQAHFEEVFSRTADAILKGVGKLAFKPQRAVNAALVDALMVAVARRIVKAGPILKPTELKAAYVGLLRDAEFAGSISRATADEESVRQRLKIAYDRIKTVH